LRQLRRIRWRTEGCGVGLSRHSDTHSDPWPTMMCRTDICYRWPAIRIPHRGYPRTLQGLPPHPRGHSQRLDPVCDVRGDQAEKSRDEEETVSGTRKGMAHRGREAGECGAAVAPGVVVVLPSCILSEAPYSTPYWRESHWQSRPPSLHLAYCRPVRPRGPPTSASPLSDTALRRHETSNLRTVSSSSNLRLEIPIPVLSLQLVHCLC
jgi:hypothetical protein